MTYEMLFTGNTWDAVGDIAIARDVREKYVIGMDGLVPPYGLLGFNCGLVAAI